MQATQVQYKPQVNAQPAHNQVLEQASPILLSTYIYICKLHLSNWSENMLSRLQMFHLATV
jgi:hypothetical protein